MKNLFEKVIELLNNLDFYFWFTVFIMIISIVSSDISVEITMLIYLLIFLNFLLYLKFKEDEDEFARVISLLVSYIVENPNIGDDENAK